eukprot:Gregarina_sp_Poly_1__4966@NODE_262_length_10455_cov_153_948017_g229_i0_p5_GENE_NODE_262_length_10455_cov_153_948017_g229_i0NODE_262_length_10455_cov_153_948017_g229_i0_p5_ORF_typecomplete_len194_score40_11_NODE_262_length_10455_cov_153_948017_g229_i060016582
MKYILGFTFLAKVISAHLIEEGGERYRDEVLSLAPSHLESLLSANSFREANPSFLDEYEKYSQPPVETTNAVPAPLNPVPMHPLSLGSDFGPAAEMAQDFGAQGSEIPQGGGAQGSSLFISAAVAVPTVTLGAVVLWTMNHKRSSAEMEDRESFGIDSEEESLGDTTEDALESKFEVGNDAVVWAHQADFSAF